MSVVLDRLKASFFALVRAAGPRAVYAAPRICRVVSSATAADGSTTLDVVPEDPDFPSMSRVPLFHGLPGVQLTLGAGTRVVVEFSEGDPARALCRSWAGGETVTALSIGGGDAGAVVLDALLAPYLKAIKAHTHPETGTTTAVSPMLQEIPPVATSVVSLK